MNYQSLLETASNPIWFLLLIFGFGILGGLFSCALIEVPFLSSLTSSKAVSTKNTLIKVLSFMMGMTISYLVIGFLFSKISLTLTRHPLLSGLSYAILGILGILWGISIVIEQIKSDSHAHHDHTCACGCHSHTIFPHFFNPLLAKITPTSNFHFLILGILFAWLETPACPCCGPVLYILSALTVAKGKIWLGVLTFVIYSMGQSIPVIVLCTALTRWVTHPVLQKSRPYIQMLMGNILIFIGMVMLWLI